MLRDVFISYSSKDKAIADAVCLALEEKGVGCWIAPRDIPGGTNYGAEISKAISNCRILVLVFTENSNTSEAVFREVQMAFDAKKRIIPVRINELTVSHDLSFYLSGLQWTDVSPGGSFDRLIDSVNGLLSGGMQPGNSQPDSTQPGSTQPGNLQPHTPHPHSAPHTAQQPHTPHPEVTLHPLQPGVSAKITLTPQHAVINGPHIKILNGYLSEMQDAVSLAVSDILFIERHTLRKKKLLVTAMILFGLLLLAYGSLPYFPSDLYFAVKSVIYAILLVSSIVFIAMYVFKPVKVLRIKAMGGDYAVRLACYEASGIDNLIKTYYGRK